MNLHILLEHFAHVIEMISLLPAGGKQSQDVLFPARRVSKKEGTDISAPTAFDS